MSLAHVAVALGALAIVIALIQVLLLPFVLVSTVIRVRVCVCPFCWHACGFVGVGV